ncbi:serine hydrolase [Muricauda sp. TY007]|uniref:serine hydrolase domain-containing protein n=1 Tax=Allomuricauda sp. TY007 TaxID=2683200 RepID=UPI001EF2D6B5|nr:serine hydrolase domain-containing protein [Muricauda sp. TY007]
MRYMLPIIRIILLSIAILAARDTCAQNKYIETVEGNTLPLSKLEAEVVKAMKANNIPGVSMAIINKNKMVYHNVFGVANSETGTLVTKASIFEGASLSKPIFAYFVMKMVEEGVLDLDKPLHEYLPHPGIAPESVKDYKLITARMVLAHQTGFPNHANGEPIKLAFAPGTDFMYSGEAYQYLAAVIGQLKGVGFKERLNELFQKEVTIPLNMEHTTFIWDDYLKEHKVFGHNSEGKPTQNSPAAGGWSGKTFNAFSSVHSEASEYAKFIIAMLKRKGLKNDTFEAMLKEETHFSDNNPLKKEIGQTGWGLGFAQKVTSKGTMHMHTGNNHDFQAYAMFMPEKEYGLVVFTNCDKMPQFLEALSVVMGPQF